MHLFSVPSAAAAVLHFSGSQHLTVTDLNANGVTEAEDLSFRFRTRQSDALLVATRDDGGSTDRLEIMLENGRLVASIHMGLTEKAIPMGGGGGLNDDQWHSVWLRRRRMTIRLGVDDDKPIVAEIYGSESFLDCTSLHVAAVAPAGNTVSTSAPPLRGYIQQLVSKKTNSTSKTRRYKLHTNLIRRNSTASSTSSASPPASTLPTP